MVSSLHWQLPMDRIESMVDHYNQLTKTIRYHSARGCVARAWDNPYDTAEPYDVTEKTARNYDFFTRRHMQEQLIVTEGWRITYLAKRRNPALQDNYQIIKREGKLRFYKLNEPHQIKDILLFIGISV